MSWVHWLFGVSALLLAVYLMVRCFRLDKILSLNIILVMFVCHVLQQVGAAVFFALDSPSPAAPVFFLASALTALLIPVGGLIGNAIFPVTPGLRARFQAASLGDSPAIRRAAWKFFLVYFAGCLVLFLFYIRTQESVPVQGLITGALDPEEFREARLDSLTQGVIYGMGHRFFMPLLFLLGLIGATYFRATSARLACIAAIAVAIAYNAWSGSKTPVAMLFLLAFVVMLMRLSEIKQSQQQSIPAAAERRATRRKMRRIYWLAAIFAVLIIAYPVFIFLFKPAAAQGLGYLLLHVFLRILFKPAENSYIAFEAFTFHWDYTYFSDVKRLADLFGWPLFDLSQRIAVYRGFDAITNAPPTATGTFYGQGGWPVLVVGVLFAAAVFKVVENLILRLGVKTPVLVALYVLLLYGAFRFSWANFHTILMTETVVPLLVTLAAWHFLARIRLLPSSGPPEMLPARTDLRPRHGA